MYGTGQLLIPTSDLYSFNVDDFQLIKVKSMLENDIEHLQNIKKKPQIQDYGECQKLQIVSKICEYWIRICAKRYVWEGLVDILCEMLEFFNQCVQTNADEIETVFKRIWYENIGQNEYECMCDEICFGIVHCYTDTTS